MAEQRTYQGQIYARNAPNEPWALVGPAPNQPVTIGTPDPRIDAKEERAQAAADRQAEAAARDAQNDAISNQLKMQELEIKRQQAEREGNTAKQLSEWRANLSNIGLLEKTVADLREQYDEHFKGKGLKSIAEEFAPARFAPQYGVFDATAQSMLADMAKAKGLTAQQFNTPAEQRMFFEPLIPKRGDTDEVIEQKLANLERMIATGRKTTEQNLGVDAQQSDNELAAANAVPDNSPPDLPPANQGGNNPVGPVASGGGMKDLARPDINSMVQSMMAAGAGLATINSALKAKGASPIPMADFARAKQWMAQNPGKAYPVNAQETRELTMLERLAGSPLGSGVANYANSATAGTAAALAGERGKGALEAMQAVNPNASLIGNIAGGITGALGAEAMLGTKLAGTAAAKFAPRLADFGFGATTGFNAAEDGAGLEGAALGGVTGAFGGAIGERVVRGAGKALSGVTDPAVQYLRGLGVPLTAGQALGGIVKSVEDKATSMPFVGDMIVNRRMEGLEAFDRAAMNQAASPIAFTPENIGKEGVGEMLDAAGNAYENATAGARVDLDPQYVDDFTAVTGMGQALPDDLRARFGLALSNRVNPINDAGAMTGETYQQAMRGIKSYKSEATKPGFEQDYRSALSAAQDALTAQMMRGGGEDVVSGLRAADNAYRGIKTVEDAAMRADGANYIFTPSQLQDALKKTDRKFPGSSPLSELADMGQQVLPSRIPDSGTAGRAAQLLVPGAVGGAAGYGASGDVSGAGAGSLGMTLALLAGGTKTGQRAITAALLDRPEALTRAGKLLADLAKFGGGVGTGVSTPLLVGQ